MQAHRQPQAQVRAAVMAEAARVGVDHLRRNALVHAFAGRGAARSTLYRWIDATLKSGMPGQSLARQIKASAAGREIRTTDPVAEVVADICEALPVVPTVEDIVGRGATSVVDDLRNCVQIARRIIKKAETPDGKIRNARLIMQGGELLRRCADTAARVQSSVMRSDELGRFHETLLEEIRKESPECAERILMRTRAITENRVTA